MGLQRIRHSSSKIILLIIAALAGCGGGSDGDSSKNLFSTWYGVEDDSVIDLKGADFGRKVDYTIFAKDGSECLCHLSTLGEQSRGAYSLNSCFYVPGSGGGDPGCNGLNHTGTFSKTNDTLELCDSVGCSQYK